MDGGGRRSGRPRVQLRAPAGPVVAEPLDRYGVEPHRPGVPVGAHRAGVRVRDGNGVASQGDGPALERADDALVLGHRLSEWCGKAPMMEEEMALSNTALDLIGRDDGVRVVVITGAGEKSFVAGADINESNKEDGTALILAAQNGHEKAALALLARGANPKLTDGYGLTAMHWAVQEGIKTMFGRPSETDEKWEHNNMPNLVKALLAAGADPMRLAILSGPNLASEVAAAMPAAAVLAGPAQLVEMLQSRLARPTLRLYATDDLVGVEVAGAMKNVIAIAVSAVRALGYGENASAALLSRGVAEMVRLTEACGGRGETACGLAGVGDLVLTASNTGSRNARLGALLASGETVAAAVASIGATIEGIPTAHGALALAARLGIELPITAAVVSVLEHGTPVASIAKGLLGRSPAREWR